MAAAAYAKIVGHEAVIARLKAAVDAGRVAHAYLFSGPAGVGKRTTALQFARALLCDKRGEDDCRDCAGVENGSHLHLAVVERADDREEISIQQVRRLIEDLSLKPSLDKRRVVVIRDAERMSEEAMNALLKTLEEPPQGCVFVLTSAALSALLPTIRSRCQTVRFSPLSEDRVRKHLESLGRTACDAALAARLTGGCVGRALAGDRHIGDVRKLLEETLEHILRRNLNPIVENVTRIRDPKESRREATLLLDLLLLSLREALRARAAGANPDPAILPAAAAEQLSRLSEEEIVDRIDALLEHRRFLDLYANVGLTVENALLRI